MEGGIALARAGRVVRLRWPADAQGEATVLRASVDPIAGWVSRRFDRKAPCATLAWRGRISGRTVLRTLVEC
jgi:hypothetical protein